MRVLFASSEYYPLMKTGGLADVSASLPAALHSLEVDIRVVIPAYRDALERALVYGVKVILATTFNGYGIRILETKLPEARHPVWMLDCPALFDRPGSPYQDDTSGSEYPDNADRFGLLSAVTAALALGKLSIDWRPELLHINDWQVALAAAWIKDQPERPPVLFTIHNLAYQGVFDRAAFDRLGLPNELWHPDSLEFYGQFSFIKAGLTFSDHVSTVSPSYAEEIQTAAFGCGLEGVMQRRRHNLSGILNGIDTRFWNPATDPALAATYSPTQLDRKHLNKTALQAELGLDPDPQTPLFAFIGRLAEQKGIDLLIDVIPGLMALGAQIAIQGTGSRALAAKLEELAATNRGRVAFTDAYSENRAHRIEAGADIFLMPSRFEPCGLNQLYSMRYGTVPVVRAVGGLRDTVIDTTDATIEDRTATGFCFDDDSSDALFTAACAAVDRYRDQECWRQIQLNGMRKDFSWQSSASRYVRLYEQMLA